MGEHGIQTAHRAQKGRRGWFLADLGDQLAGGLANRGNFRIFAEVLNRVKG